MMVVYLYRQQLMLSIASRTSWPDDKFMNRLSLVFLRAIISYFGLVIQSKHANIRDDENIER